MLGVLGIILSLALLIFLAYRGITVLILAPILALIATLFNGGTPLLPTYTEVFMKSFGNYAKAYFPIFLLGAIFGKIMDDSGAAKSIASFIGKKIGKGKAVLAVVLSCAILTYGGVSLFVVAFAVFPIAAALFRESDIPKRLIPGTIALGAFTFTMTALPGSPQIQNAIPMPFFGTNAYAAPILGIIAAIVMFGCGMVWLTYRVKKAVSAGEGYGSYESEKINKFDESKLPSFSLSIIPIVLVLVINFILAKYYFPTVNGNYLTQAPYNTKMSAVLGTWSLILALLISILIALVLFRKQFADIKKTLNEGAFGSMLAIINTSSEVGYGNVIAALAAFAIVKAAVLGISSNPIISEAISVNILSGITGSASGGMSIALGTLGKSYMDLAAQHGINPQVLHRIASLASGGFDTLPHNGAVITLLSICGMTHRQSYKDIGMVSVLIPLLALVVTIIFATLGVV